MWSKPKEDWLCQHLGFWTCHWQNGNTMNFCCFKQFSCGPLPWIKHLLFWCIWLLAVELWWWCLLPFFCAAWAVWSSYPRNLFFSPGSLWNNYGPKPEGFSLGITLAVLPANTQDTCILFGLCPRLKKYLLHIWNANFMELLDFYLLNVASLILWRWATHTVPEGALGTFSVLGSLFCDCRGLEKSHPGSSTLLQYPDGAQ